MLVTSKPRHEPAELCGRLLLVCNLCLRPFDSRGCEIQGRGRCAVSISITILQQFFKAIHVFDYWILILDTIDTIGYYQILLDTDCDSILWVAEETCPEGTRVQDRYQIVSPEMGGSWWFMLPQ